jgi:hypothetical protein
MLLHVNDEEMIMETRENEYAKSYAIDGIACVIDPKKQLRVKFLTYEIHVNPTALLLEQDDEGNPMITIPLTRDSTLYARDIFIIDDTLIDILRDTSTFALIDGRQSHYAVGCFEIVTKRCHASI